MRFGFMTMVPMSLLLACSSGSDQGRLLAEVNDEQLFQSDLGHLFASARYSVEDSAAIAQDYVEMWVEEQILVQRALESEEVNLEEIDQKAERFKNQMIIHELMKSEVENRLDTNVSANEIRAYYTKHQEEYQLNDYLVKVLYMKVPFDAPNIDRISSVYKLYSEKDLAEIEEYAQIYATNFYYDNENWIYFDDLLKEIPLQDIKKDRFITKRSKIRFEEGGYYYFLNVLDYKLKNTLSPMEFEEENIKRRIVSIRLKDLQDQIRQEMITEAKNEGKIQIYE